MFYSIYSRNTQPSTDDGEISEISLLKMSRFSNDQNTDQEYSFYITCMGDSFFIFLVWTRCYLLRSLWWLLFSNFFLRIYTKNLFVSMEAGLAKMSMFILLLPPLRSIFWETKHLHLFCYCFAAYIPSLLFRGVSTSIVSNRYYCSPIQVIWQL